MEESPLQNYKARQTALLGMLFALSRQGVTEAHLAGMEDRESASRGKLPIKPVGDGAQKGGAGEVIKTPVTSRRGAALRENEFILQLIIEGPGFHGLFLQARVQRP